MNKHQKQLEQNKLEEKMSSDGKIRYRNRFQGIRGKNETANNVGRRLLESSIEIAEKGIEGWMVREAAHKLERGKRARANADLYDLLLDIEKVIGIRLVAALTSRSILDSISVHKRATRTAMTLANVIENEWTLSKIEEDAPSWLAYYRNSLGTKGPCTDKGTIIYRQKRLKQYLNDSRSNRTWVTWTNELKLKLGTLLLDLFCTSTGLTSIEMRNDIRGRRYATISPTPTTLEKLDEWHDYAEILKPVYKPCVTKPQDWTTPFDGGYFTPQLYQAPLVKTSDRDYLKELEQTEMPEVYKSVNRLQSTKWTINTEIFSIMEEFWATGNDGAGLPARKDEELPTKPWDIDTNKDERDEWRRSARDVHAHNEKQRGQRLGFMKTLTLAKEYIEKGEFYFVWQLDWRSRTYPVSYFYLQPQGPDFGKALLLFKDGKELATDSAKMWFKVQGANTFGMDKLSLKDRVKWVDSNEELILNCAMDPFFYTDWQNCSSPWGFLAFCIEYTQWKENPNFLSRLPIAQDAAQSGLQILSLLVKDEVGAAETNLTPTDKPNDLYQSVADKVTELLREAYQTTDAQILESIKKLNLSYNNRSKSTTFCEEKEKRKLSSNITQAKLIRDNAAIWLDLGIDRSMVKRSTMTKVYNASNHSMTAYLKESALEKGLDIPKKHLFKTCSFLASFVKKAIDIQLKGASLTMKYLGEVAKASVKAECALRWYTPAGFPVKQQYMRNSAIKVKTKIDGVIRLRTLSRETDKINSRKQRNAFSPNLVHSIDAALMMKTVNSMPEDTSFCMVHDSFATHAADSGLLATTIRNSYYETFKDPVLADIIDNIKANLPKENIEDVPDLPEMGLLDIEDILKSSYMFS